MTKGKDSNVHKYAANFMNRGNFSLVFEHELVIVQRARQRGLAVRNGFRRATVVVSCGNFSCQYSNFQFRQARFHYVFALHCINQLRYFFRNLAKPRFRKHFLSYPQLLWITLWVSGS